MNWQVVADCGSQVVSLKAEHTRFLGSGVKAKLTGCSDLQELEEGIGDVDLFTLQEDRETVTVNAKWLQHLQVQQLSRI